MSPSGSSSRVSALPCSTPHRCRGAAHAAHVVRTVRAEIATHVTMRPPTSGSWQEVAALQKRIALPLSRRWPADEQLEWAHLSSRG